MPKTEATPPVESSGEPTGVDVPLTTQTPPAGMTQWTDEHAARLDRLIGWHRVMDSPDTPTLIAARDEINRARKLLTEAAEKNTP